MLKFVRGISKLSDWSGRILSGLTAVLVAIMVFEVVMRYVFDSPTIWVHELSGYIYVSMSMMGGAYVLRHNAHVNVDIFSSKLSARKRAILDIATALVMLLICWMLVRYGGMGAWKAIRTLEHSPSPWGSPIYYPKLMVFVGAVLLTLQVIAKLICDIYLSAKGREIS